MKVCRRASGVPVKCAFGHCTSFFHPLCGRTRGYYLAVRPGLKGAPMYRPYCATHSDGQRQKDREAAERAAAAAAAGVSAQQDEHRGGMHGLRRCVGAALGHAGSARVTDWVQ